MTVTALPCQADGRFWTLTRWRSLARTSGKAHP